MRTLLFPAIGSFVATLTFTHGSLAASTPNDYPTRPIRLVVGFLPGGTTDALARVLATQLQQQLPRTVVVDNRAGAGGLIGYNMVAKAAPDGYTLLYMTSSFVTAAVSTPDLPFDPRADFAPVTLYVRGVSNVLVATPSLPANSLKEVLALAKNPEKPVSYGSAGGIGTIQHFVGEMFSQRAGVKLLHVPYKGQGQALSAIMSGEIQLLFLQPPVGVDLIKAGKLKPIAFCGSARWSTLPDLPTLSESGLAGFSITPTYQGVLAPARTPRPVIQKLHEELRQSLSAPAVRDFLSAATFEPDGRGPDEFRPFLAAELKRFADVARAADIKLR